MIEPRAARHPPNCRARSDFCFRIRTIRPSVCLCWEEVAFGLRRRKVPVAEARQRALASLATVGLDTLAQLHPYRLSRGQRQLLAVASVLVLDPQVVVVDEPSTGLDYAQTLAIMDQLDAFRTRAGLSC